MQSLLFGVHALDLTAFSAVGAILMTSVALAPLACWIPAHRAASGARLMQVLRTE